MYVCSVQAGASKNGEIPFFTETDLGGTSLYLPPLVRTYAYIVHRTATHARFWILQTIGCNSNSNYSFSCIFLRSFDENILLSVGNKWVLPHRPLI